MVIFALYSLFSQVFHNTSALVSLDVMRRSVEDRRKTTLLKELASWHCAGCMSLGTDRRWGTKVLKWRPLTGRFSVDGRADDLVSGKPTDARRVRSAHYDGNLWEGQYSVVELFRLM